MFLRAAWALYRSLKGSTLHKLREVVKTLEAKEDPDRYKSQITLARRRIQAFTIAGDLIRQELDKKE